MEISPEAVVRRIRDTVAANGWMRLQLGEVAAQRPVDELEYWLMAVSSALGALVPQTYAGNLIARIRDEGGNYGSHEVRGHQTDAQLAPHSDRSDWNLIFYVRPAQSGGELAVVGYEEAALALRDEDPAAYAALFEAFPFDLRVERIFPEIEWHCRPILWRNAAGAIRGHYIRRFITDAQRHSASPPLSATQVAALDAFDSVVSRLGQVRRFAPGAGDMVILDNYRVMHARTAFSDHADTGRLALRTWIAPAQSEALPEFIKPMVGSCGAGTFRGGVNCAEAYLARLGQPVLAIA